MPTTDISHIFCSWGIFLCVILYIIGGRDDSVVADGEINGMDKGVGGPEEEVGLLVDTGGRLMRTCRGPPHL